jgi:hypothetical protein
MVVPAIWSQEKRPAFPNSPPPAFVFVAGVDRDKGIVVVHTRHDVLIPTTVAREVQRNGIKVVETVTEYVQETRIVHQEMALKSLRILDREGKEVVGEDLWKRLTPGILVFQQSGAQPVDAAYRRVLARDTLILAPREEGPKKAPR